MVFFGSLSGSTVLRARTLLFVGSVLATSSVTAPYFNVAHAAGDDSASLDVLEKQMARIQAQQMELQKTLVSMQKQIAAHRAALTHGG